MAIESIAKTLGTGSGIDIKGLVDQLVEASFQNKNAQLTAKSEALTAQISKVGELKSAISDFATALAQLTSSGALSTQPTSANTGIVNVSRLSGADLTGLGATLEVRQLAQAQVASTDPFAGGASTALAAGTLTLTFGKASVSDGAMTGFTAGGATPVSITIDAAHATLGGVADAINAANAGVKASILTDSSGARLVLKGANGESQAFTLTGSAGLEALDIGPGASGSAINATAQDAVVLLDGVQTQYSSNSIYSLIEGVKVDLVSAAVGTKVAIGSRVPTAEITQSVTNLVDTYNQVYAMVKAAVDPISGSLRGDPAAKDLLRQLKGLTLAPLVPDAPAGAPRTLADIGVATTRDGTLNLDSARLSKVLTDFPVQLEAIFAQSSGITKALSDIATRATSKTTGLGASETN